MSLRLFGRLNAIIGFSFLRENTVELCVCFNDLPVLVNVLYFGEIRVVRYYKRYYGLCLICILGVHVFVCCLLW